MNAWLPPISARSHALIFREATYARVVMDTKLLRINPLAKVRFIP